MESPPGFWDKKFDEIEDDLPKNEPGFSQVVRPAKEQAKFEAVLPMDAFVGRFLYVGICLVVLLCVLTGLFLFGLASKSILGLTTFFVTSVPVFCFFAMVYRIRANYVNNMTISIRNDGISIHYHKQLPWPCWDLHIPAESIEQINIECNTVRASWLLPNAEYSHTTYSSRTSYNYVFVYDLKCKLK
ncbi:MAG: hypothetical protein ACKOAU_12230, partial [Pirellula sp.]